MSYRIHALLLLFPVLAQAQVGSPAGPVPPERLAARREALMDRLGTGIAVLQGTSERSIDPPDAEYPQDTDFRQDNDFFYLTGLEVPDAWLVLIARANGPDQVQLFLPARNPAQERWLGVRLGPGPESAAVAGLPARAVRSVEERDRVLDSLLSAADSPVRSGPLFLKHTARLAGSGWQRLVGQVARTENLIPHLAALRVIKDTDEQARLRRAIAISGAGHLAAMRVAAPGVWEYELEAAAEYEFRRLGAERLGYPSIVGAGINSTVLHYDESRAQLKAGDLIVMDMGAEFGYYSADVTRTIPATGRFTDRQRAVYDLVLAAQQAALDSIRPGVTIARLEAIARRVMRERSGSLCGPRTCDAYFIHGLGHYIGMDVHDVGRYDIPLAPGMVFTVEPGIYLPEEGLGVRIEDDVLVTATGYELLSGGVPRKASEIEALMAK
ncbi:MAG TPA: aminopeptidase P family protein [Gemmatimonadales bacterium]